jgi:hypothetical protein
MLFLGFPGSGSGVAGGDFVEDGQQREDAVHQESFVAKAGFVQGVAIF